MKKALKVFISCFLGGRGSSFLYRREAILTKLCYHPKVKRSHSIGLNIKKGDFFQYHF